MKAIAYNIGPKEKESLILANHKKHEITIISNSLTIDTLNFADGKEALIVFNRDHIDGIVIAGLAKLGIKYIASSTFGYDYIDVKTAKRFGLKIANIPFEDGGTFENMHQVITNLDNWAEGKCVGEACCCKNNCSTNTKDLR
jgi:lactate dehydrogenase-like 2-hydroxyacid dehydrogenase